NSKARSSRANVAPAPVTPQKRSIPQSRSSSSLLLRLLTGLFVLDFCEAVDFRFFFVLVFADDERDCGID
ncbi:unnamed protein product, partial [Rotaria socialis]